LTFTLSERLEQLEASGIHTYLKGTRHGIEREGLRVDRGGVLSQCPHPLGLGSALTNPNITTDFSESLLEFITPVFQDPITALEFLENLQRFTNSHLGDELLWVGSMPCHIPDPSVIPIARYGSSHLGRVKYIYRLGLEQRYGKMMQCIAGIHYNFSISEEFLQAFQQHQEDVGSLQTFRSDSYFRLIRNFRRHSWLLNLLFGASPALCESFLQGASHNLEKLYDNTLYLPYATSLRMSDIGYSTRVQSSVNICFNHLDSYLESLSRAVQTPYPPYGEIGVKVDGRYRQLNDTILQIENEHYSDVRPKRVARNGERPIQALHQNGVEYIEIRNIDINPFLPLGIDSGQALFLDIFLISCLLMDEQNICVNERRLIMDNAQKIVTSGRQPRLLLNTMRGERFVSELAGDLLDQLRMTAILLDEIHQTHRYSQSVDAQYLKVEDTSQTPSAMIVDALKTGDLEYHQWVLEKSREHKATLGSLPSTTAQYQELSKCAALVSGEATAA